MQTFYAEYFLKLRKIIPQLQAYIEHNYTNARNARPGGLLRPIPQGGSYAQPATKASKRTRKRTREAMGPQGLAAYGDNFDTVRSLRELVQLAGNTIQAYSFYQPDAQITYLDAQLGQFALFKKELAGITDYWDFSGLNSVITTITTIITKLHYRPFVGDMMLNVMFGAPAVHVPRDFGFHVSPANMDGSP